MRKVAVPPFHLYRQEAHQRLESTVVVEVQMILIWLVKPLILS